MPRMESSKWQAEAELAVDALQLLHPAAAAAAAAAAVTQLADSPHAAASAAAAAAASLVQAHAADAVM